jgi:hypothetical protein
MSYEVTTTPQFEREAKPLIKKYSSLASEKSEQETITNAEIKKRIETYLKDL